MIKMIMHGCNGKMGRVISAICKEDDAIEIIAGVDPYQGIENDYPVFSNITECDVEADVVVDFASATAVDGLLDYCVAHKLPVVLCTTGLSQEQLARAGFDMEIVEKHHNQKVDAPSGTALALADSINEALENAYSYKYDRTPDRKKREQYEIGIQAVRGGSIVGEHEVIFAGTDEVIEFKHTAYSKAVFAKGAVEAAKYLAGRSAGRYEMQDVIAER